MLSALTALLGLLQIAHAINFLEANTTSGLVRGFINERTPNVAQFLGIPFAEPPVGARRWAPAVPKSKENGIINATRFGPACPQWETDMNVEPNAYTVDNPDFTPAPPDYQSEDCLSLSIWTPWLGANATQSAKEPLPVFLWVYGGGYTTGGSNVPYQYPAPWVEKSGKHIVVSIK
jgi:acetylcholinesterase